jgi:prepilin signal peptidase PulO-like enzyme (type II secretory pathway)
VIEMLRSHLLLLVVFAFFVSLVFAALTKDDVREQLRFGGMLFVGFVAAALVLGWLMLPIPF